MEGCTLLRLQDVGGGRQNIVRIQVMHRGGLRVMSDARTCGGSVKCVFCDAFTCMLRIDHVLYDALTERGVHPLCRGEHGERVAFL